MSFQNLFLLIIGLVFFISCDSENKKVVVAIENKVQEKVPETDSAQLALEKWMKSYISDYNVVEKLTEYGDNNPEDKIIIYTNYGIMKLKLYKETALHRANFVMLTKKKIFNKSMFYRVIKDFMIQGGNSDDEEIIEKMNRIGSYGIPNEINLKYPHKFGALAMAVSHEDQERDKTSSAVNFYIVKGQKLPSSYLDKLKAKGTRISKKSYNIYLNKGGAAHLDGKYTVFGELTSGFSVLSRISKVKTSKYNWPKKKIVIDSIIAY